MLFLGACYAAPVEPERPIEYITPTPTRGPLRLAVASDGPVPTWTPTATVAIPATPAPVVAKPPPVLQRAPGVEQWRPLVSAIFPASAVETVLRIMACESGGNANATGSAGERGLMQIHPLHYDSTYDPEGNLRAAYRISQGGASWWAWTCAR